jgi:hypothetical protein
LSGSESVQVYIVCLYLLEIPLTSLFNPRQDMDFQHHMNCVVTFFLLYFFFVSLCSFLFVDHSFFVVLFLYNKKAMINKKKTTQWHKEKVQQKNYDQQKENYTMTQRKSTTKKLWSTKRKLHNDTKKKYSFFVVLFLCVIV